MLILLLLIIITITIPHHRRLYYHHQKQPFKLLSPSTPNHQPNSPIILTRHIIHSLHTRNLGMSSQSTIHITFELPPKSLPRFYKALKTLQQHVIAEPECVYFNCFELPKQPGKVRIVEIWNQDKKWRKEVSFLFCFESPDGPPTQRTLPS